MGFTAEDVIRALREVIHPENEKDIISLGLVKDVQVEGKKVSFTLELKKSNDPFANSLKKASVMAVKSKVDNSAEIEGNITIKA
ncbi:MAG: iron-sulfur cluster assembly protein, partial [Bacteroidetes bacterium]|nr:iron-sulfur cluster assembly protein [Bacteroidota bacterium]